MRRMRNQLQLRQALLRLTSVEAFARKHKLVARTLWRIRAGDTADVRMGTQHKINAALDKERGVAS